MVAVSQNVVGVDLDEVITPGMVAPSKQRFKTGQTVIGDDGNRYQYARANAAISAGTATCNITVSSGEYVVAATGGSAVSPATAMASGDFGWFQIG